MNKNHKWEELNEGINRKWQKCLRCGLEKYWSREYQAWEYLDLRTNIGTQRSTYTRPNCDPDRKPFDGFDNQGHYIIK